MTATDFEVRHQTLIHLLIVGVAFLTYLIDRDDIVWALVQGQTHPRLFERLLFALATLLIGVSTALRTWAGAYAERPASGLAVTLVMARTVCQEHRVAEILAVLSLLIGMVLNWHTPFGRE